jgi:aromatic ring-opening dioxygenase LigB subunit
VIVAAAVCPHPPALVPELASGAADELADVRDAALEAVAELISREPERIVVIGGRTAADPEDERAAGSLMGYGVDVRTEGERIALPLSLTVGAWLLDRIGWSGRRTYANAAVPLDDRVALLVMADGTARRDVTAPGYLDERAEAYDEAIAQALRDGDATALSELDVELGDELLAAGVRALVVLGEMTKGADVTARLRWDGAPFGVAYWVANWQIES